MRSDFALESDVCEFLPRMQQAARDVLINKATWRDASVNRRTAWEPTTVTPINLVTQTAATPISVATSMDAEPAIVPDQAPVASFTVTAAATGSPSSFDATKRG